MVQHRYNILLEIFVHPDSNIDFDIRALEPKNLIEIENLKFNEIKQQFEFTISVEPIRQSKENN